MRKHKLMTNEQLAMFYVEVLKIAAFERGHRRKAKELIRLIMAEMLRRGM